MPPADPFQAGPTATQQIVAGVVADVVAQLMTILDSDYPPEVQVGAVRTALDQRRRDPTGPFIAAPAWGHHQPEETR